jgi:hypothetical protein
MKVEVEKKKMISKSEKIESGKIKNLREEVLEKAK